MLLRLRDDILDTLPSNQLEAAILGLFTVVIAFQPAAVLLLLQQRGSILGASKGNAVSPFSSLLWKRIVDWVLIGLTFIIYIASMGNYAAYATAMDTGYSTRSFSAYMAASKGISYAGTALGLLLFLNVIITSIVLFVQAKRAQWTDPVTRRICHIGVPIFAIFALDWLIFTIYFANAVFYSADAVYTADLPEIIIEGVCRLGITTLLIFTMGLPGVEWVPTGGAPSYLETPGQWSNGKQEGNQPPFIPQQPYYQQ